MTTKGSGFTLIEVLVVCVIIAVLAGILFPVFGRAKKSAKVEVGKEYLKQQYVFIELYTQDNDGVYPDWETVTESKRMHAPCSPLDHWRTPCWSRSSPMLGSFGYSLAIKGDGVEDFSKSSVFPLLADIFSADYRLPEFTGLAYDSYQDCARTHTCDFPERIWFAYSDGSLREQRNVVPNPLQTQPHMLFGWYAAFHRQVELDKRNGSG